MNWIKRFLANLRSCITTVAVVTIVVYYLGRILTNIWHLRVIEMTWDSIWNLLMFGMGIGLFLWVFFVYSYRQDANK